jgi:hypothetical protein
MSEIKIARFVGIDACESIFSERSTFVLRSPMYYRRLYETDQDKGDKKEGCPDTAMGTSNFDRWLMSCWTMLKGAEPIREEWDIFKEKEQNVLAIVSTPSQVRDFLNDVFKSGTFLHKVKDDEVEYDKEKVKVDSKNITKVVPFVKPARFTNQKEYRFVLSYGHSYRIDSFIFCGGPDYMETCYVNPRVSKKQKYELLKILDEACLGDGDFRGRDPRAIVANYNLVIGA